MPENENDYLLSLARRVADVYLAGIGPRAILLTGSIARGEADRFSDIDMIAYYDDPPGAQQVLETRSAIEAATPRKIQEEPGLYISDFFSIRGVECQVVHQRVSRAEDDINAVLDDFSVDALLHKKAIGVQEGISLHGGDLIRAWQGRLSSFPDELATAMVSHYLGGIFPIWYLQEYVSARDALLWRQQLIVESIQNLLGVLAGLNRHYYSTFQFKRTGRFIESLDIAPHDLARRIDSLLVSDPAAAPGEIERLDQETVKLVNRHMPDVSTEAVGKWLGKRQEPWNDG